MRWTRTRSAKPDYELIARLEKELRLNQPAQAMLLDDGTLVQKAPWPELATTTITTASCGTVAVVEVERNPVLDAGFAWLLGSAEGLRSAQSDG
jgi:hypothetical protein